MSAYAVSPADPQTIYACLVEAGSTQITIWRTRNAGQYWSRLPISAAFGNDCSLSIAPDQPQRIALNVTNNNANQPSCIQNRIYLSTNSGDSWQRIMPDLLVPQNEDNCSSIVTVTSRSLYMWYSYGGGQNSLQRSLLEYYDNASQSWSRADSDFEPGSLFSPPQIGPDGTLATIVRSSTTSVSALWTSHDSGHSWQKIHTMPQPIGIFLQQSHSETTTQAPLYALAQEQIPSNLYQLQIFQSMNGDCALCWNGQFAGSQQNSYLYVYHWSDKDNIFRLRLPALP